MLMMKVLYPEMLMIQLTRSSRLTGENSKVLIVFILRFMPLAPIPYISTMKLETCMTKNKDIITTPDACCCTSDKSNACATT